MSTTAVDLSLLSLRCGLGGMLAAHGVNKIFGAGGLAGTTRWFESLGLHPAWLHARLAAATEVGAALLMLLGLLTPLACGAFVGLMLVAARTDHLHKGFFVFKGGWEYVGFVGLVAVCVAALGPGRWSLDSAVHWRLMGIGWASVALLAGVVSASGTLVLGRASRHGHPHSEPVNNS